MLFSKGSGSFLSYRGMLRCTRRLTWRRPPVVTTHSPGFRSTPSRFLALMSASVFGPPDSIMWLQMPGSFDNLESVGQIITPPPTWAMSPRKSLIVAVIPASSLKSFGCFFGFIVDIIDC